MIDRLRPRDAAFPIFWGAALTKGVKMGYNTYGAEVPVIMENQELLNQIAELTAQIRGLPKGYISKKENQ